MTDPNSDSIPPPSAEFIAQVTGIQRKLHAFIQSLVGNTADADDVLQETNLVLWQKSAEFQPGTNFEAWAFRIAHFQVLALRKRKQRSKLHFNEELVELIAAEAAEEFGDGFDSRRHALASCLEKLKPDQRKLIATRYEPGACVNAIAKAQGRSAKAVSEALRRIRKTLMTCIEQTLEKEARA